MIKAIDPQQLLTQMKAMQAQASQSPVTNATASSTESGRVDFANVIKSAVDQVNETQQASGKLKKAFEMGDPNVSLSDVMIASQKANVSFQATLQVRNKLVSAYEEVMRMSI